MAYDESKYRRIQKGAPGLTGTTGIVLMTHPDGKIEARLGIALFGYTNLSEDEMRLCDSEARIAALRKERGVWNYTFDLISDSI